MRFEVEQQAGPELVQIRAVHQAFMSKFKKELKSRDSPFISLREYIEAYLIGAVPGAAIGGMKGERLTRY